MYVYSLCHIPKHSLSGVQAGPIWRTGGDGLQKSRPAIWGSGWTEKAFQTRRKKPSHLHFSAPPLPTPGTRLGPPPPQGGLGGLVVIVTHHPSNMERDTFVSHTSTNLIFFSLGTGVVVWYFVLVQIWQIQSCGNIGASIHLFIKIVVIYLFSSIFLNLPYVPESIMVLISQGCGARYSFDNLLTLLGSHQNALASLGSSLFASIT